MKNKLINTIGKAAAYLSAAILFSLNASAQINVKSDKGDLTVRFSGRTQLDAGAYIGYPGDYGIQLNDTRFAFNASNEKWSAKVEMCYTEKTASFRDAYIGYKLSDNSSLTFGNQWMPFGYKVYGAQYKFIDNGSLDNAITPSRKIGASYTYWSDLFNIQAGVFSDGDVDTRALNNGYSAVAKFWFRPILSDNTVLHIAIAPSYTQSENSVSFTGLVPNTLVKDKAIASAKDTADYVFRGEAEVLFILDRFYAEARYQHAIASLGDGKDDLVANGAFVQASYILLGGEKQNYNKKTGLAQNPDAGSLELLARFDRLNIANVGTLNESTVGVNYFFDKNVNLKLNYVHVDTDIAGFDAKNLVESRLQFTF